MAWRLIESYRINSLVILASLEESPVVVPQRLLPIRKRCSFFGRILDQNIKTRKLSWTRILILQNITFPEYWFWRSTILVFYLLTLNKIILFRVTILVFVYQNINLCRILLRILLSHNIISPEYYLFGHIFMELVHVIIRKVIGPNNTENYQRYSHQHSQKGSYFV